MLGLNASVVSLGADSATRDSDYGYLVKLEASKPEIQMLKIPIPRNGPHMHWDVQGLGAKPPKNFDDLLHCNGAACFD